MSGFLLDLLRRPYDSYIRHHIPRTLGVYNGVVTRKYHLTDFSAADREPEYKSDLVSAARSAVRDSDTVVEIGAGFGVTTSWLAREVGDDGSVITYEGAEDQVRVTEEALTLTGDVVNEDLRERTEIVHGIVASSNVVYGPMADVKTIAPGELPDCDVLVTDCEGAEMAIIPALTIRPRAMVVETHPDYGAPTDRLRSHLESMEYDCRTITLRELPEGEKAILVCESR